jgi:hypothetical protein
MILGCNRYTYIAGAWLILLALISFIYALLIL